MKNFILLILCIVPTLAWSQTKSDIPNQPGVVRTQTIRPDEKGKPIEKVLIQANQVAKTSDQNGEFLLPVIENEEKTFTYSKIEREGYELISPTKLHEKVGYNPNVKVEIVMARKDDIEKYITKIENDLRKKYRNTIETQNQQIGALNVKIEQLEQEGKNTQDLKKQLDETRAELQKYYSLEDFIPKEAERLARIDYQSIDSTQAVITDLLKGGRGEEVVRIAKAQFTPELWAKIMNDPGSIKRDMQQQKSDPVEISALLDNLANQLKNIADGYAADFKNDSTAFYLRKRVELDLDNCQYKIDCARFVSYYLAAFDEALRLYDNCLTINIKQFGEESKEAATAYEMLGHAYLNIADLSGLTYLKKALEIRKKLFGVESAEVADSYEQIGNFYGYDYSAYYKGLTFHKKALSIRMKLFGEKSAEVADSYDHMGNLYGSRKFYIKGQAFHEKALTIRINLFGEESAEVASSYNSIASTHLKGGGYPGALKYFQKSLAIKEKLFGFNNLKVAKSYQNMGVTYQTMGDYYKEALAFYEKAMEIDRNIFGETHPIIAILYNNIGGIYKRKARYEEALVFYKKALEIRENVFGEKSGEVAQVCWNIANTYYDMARSQNMECYKEALFFAEKALVALGNKYYGPGYPTAKDLRTNISVLKRLEHKD